MLGQITAVLARREINIENMLNRGRGGFAYTLLDLGKPVEESDVRELEAIEGIIRFRLVSENKGA